MKRRYSDDTETTHATSGYVDPFMNMDLKALLISLSLSAESPYDNIMDHIL